jgi:hypothetical protein
MVTSETRHVLAVIVSFGGTEGLERWAKRMSELFTRFAAGKEISIQVLQ